MKHCPCQRLANCVASHFVTWMDRWMEAVNKELSIEKYIWLCYLKTECNPIPILSYLVEQANTQKPCHTTKVNNSRISLGKTEFVGMRHCSPLHLHFISRPTVADSCLMEPYNDDKPVKWFYRTILQMCKCNLWRLFMKILNAIHLQRRACCLCDYIQEYIL